jgi:hypothetical protein
MRFKSLAHARSVGLFFGVMIAAAAAIPASAADLCPSGDVAKIRISKVTPSGSMAGIAKAVADHGKWYADHGFTEDRMIFAPILVYDAANKTMTVAADQVMTIHTHAHEVPKDRRDAAWDAYVAEYRANSEVASETVVCLPH